MTRQTWTYRLIRVFAAIALVVLVTFLLVHIVPGDPARAILGPQASSSSVSHLRHKLGLDRSMASQFGRYVSELAHGSLGTSVAQNVPVTSLITNRAAPTLALIIYSAILTVVITVPAATLAALKRGKVADHVVRVVPLFGLGLPAFWFALVLIEYLAVHLGWFPAGGYGGSSIQRLRALTLPAVVTSVSILPFTIQSLRVAMIEALDADYVAAARARGVPGRRVLLRYVLRNACAPAVVVLGLNIGWLIGNTLVVEKVFAIPGVGSLLIDSTLTRDFPVVQGLALITALFVIATNLLTEVVRSGLDPRLHAAPVGTR